MKKKIECIEDVRAGDRVTLETVGGEYQAGGETITATVVEEGGRLYVLGRHLESNHIRFISAEREVPDLPTEPGIYLDAEDGLWRLRADGVWVYEGTSLSSEDATKFAPFTRLVPETELAEQRRRMVYALCREGRPLAASLIARGEFQIERDEF